MGKVVKMNNGVTVAVMVMAILVMFGGVEAVTDCCLQCAKTCVGYPTFCFKECIKICSPPCVALPANPIGFSLSPLFSLLYIYIYIYIYVRSNIPEARNAAHK